MGNKWEIPAASVNYCWGLTTSKKAQHMYQGCKKKYNENVDIYK